MVDRYISTKFGINLFYTVSNKTGFTDGRPRHDSNPAVQ